ncbi:MAG: ABC transporter ATP-binding protein [Bacteroidales bacterium]|nr:ABC transporter ATP-binding protein [Bacteroidales bacterium]
MITCEHLSIGYRQGKHCHVVQEDLQLQVNAGELIALIGPNGCGKSTLLRTLSGLQKPLSGKIYFRGLDMSTLSLSELSRLQSIVLTQNVAIEYCKVFQMVALGRSPYTGRLGRLDAQYKSLVEEALDRVGMRSYAQKNLSDLSDGERQRVMIAKALAQNTPLIFLDEPSSHLDLSNRISLHALLGDLAKDMGKSILFSTHELELALHTAHKAWLMRAAAGGIEQASPQELLARGSVQAVFGNDDYFISSDGRVVMK